MLPRFYAPDLLPAAPSVTLPEEEGRHLVRVLRLGPGDEVAVFNGRGREVRAVVETVARDVVSLRLAEPLPVPPPHAVQTIVVQAVLKGDGMDAAIRDATMMGAEAIQPLLTAHVDVKPSFAQREATVERWRRVALASVKQCRRATVPRIGPPRTLAEWLQAPSAEMVLMFVEPSAGAARPLRDVLAPAVPTRVAVLLGPEGGWAAGELEAARAAGCLPVTLGPLTLRAESMPVAALAAINAIWVA